MKVYTQGPTVDIPAINESLAYPNVEVVPYEGAVEGKCVVLAHDPTEMVSSKGLVVFSSRYHLSEGGFVRTLINKGLDPARLAYVGAHVATPEEAMQVRGIQRYQLSTMLQEGTAEVSFALMEFVRDIQEVTIVVDMNVVDGFGPVGGMTPRQLIYFIQKLRMITPKLVITNITPASRALAGKLIAEFY